MGKTNRLMLIDFDALFDLKFGAIIYAIASDDKKCFHYKIDKSNIKNSIIERLKDERMSNRDFMSSVLCTEKNVVQRLYIDMLRTDLDNIIKYSPIVPSIERIIRLYESPEYSKMMVCHIMIRDQREINYVRKLFPNCSIIERYKTEDFDYSQYCRLVIGGYDNIEDMKETKFTHITVLSYPENFQVTQIENETIRVMNKEALCLLGITNQLELIDPDIL